MSTYISRVVNAPTPQSEPLVGQIKNSAGGFSFPVDDETRMRRFLILGSEGGSYYASERKLTLENTESVKRLIENNGPRAVDILTDVAVNRRAPKVTPIIYSLALVLTYGNDETRKLAYERFSEIIRTASHLQEFASYIDNLRGWGMGLRKAVGRWYKDMPVRDFVYQTVKYRERNDWKNTDILRSAHPKKSNTLHDYMCEWITKGTMPPADEPDFDLVRAYENAKNINDPKDMAYLIRENRMTMEMVPSEMMIHKEVWKAISEEMPITALVRNLATLTNHGVIAPLESQWVVDRINDIGVKGGKIHPIGVFVCITYLQKW